MLSAPHAVSTAVGVTALAQKDAVVELEVVAATD